MVSQIFINLPVSNLEKTKEFFAKLGFTFNPQFSDDNAICMIMGENIFCMLLVKDYFKTFTKKEIADTSKYVEVHNAIPLESKEAVDKIYQTAIDAGATPLMGVKDYGFMYQNGFQDLDGHAWEIFWMDPKGPQQPTTSA